MTHSRVETGDLEGALGPSLHILVRCYQTPNDSSGIFLHLRGKVLSCLFLLNPSFVEEHNQKRERVDLKPKNLLFTTWKKTERIL